MSTRHLVYVDGQEGTTGLKIHEMLAQRGDLEVLRISPNKRKDPAERARLINAADLVFLCLPDAASQEACNMVANPHTRLVDASTAFRTHADWVYGLPELGPGHRERIRSSKRVANPGCHATAFILLVRPLVDAGLLPAAYPVTATSITGFSGGGKKMIEEYEAAFDRTLSKDARKAKTVGASDSAAPGNGKMPEGPSLSKIFENKFSAPRPYGLGLAHKHLPEMTKHGGLAHAPLFMPIVGPFFQGLTVSIPFSGFGAGFDKEARECLAERYSGEPFVQVRPLADPDTIASGFFNSQRCNNTNRADLFVFQNKSGQVLLMACIDNLGKGASGAAVQNMNLMLGLPESAGLVGA